jgi:hypothetical protein
MAKRKAKPIKRKLEVSQMFKTVGGSRQRYVKVVIRSKGKTITRQFKYRGGRFTTYVKESTLPKGQKYYVDYTKNRIIKDLNKVEALVKQVRDREKVKRKTQKRKIKAKPKREIFKELRIVPKRIYTAPTPVEAEKIVTLLNGKVYYEREHSITEFSTKQQENAFLTNMISKGTKSKVEARKLVQNFNKIKLKMSYAIVIEGVNEQTGVNEQIATFTAIGKKPLEIVEFLKSVGLTPRDQYTDLYADVLKPFGAKLDSQGVYFNKVTGSYRITDVRMTIKFYNNPQTTLK